MVRFVGVCGFVAAVHCLHSANIELHPLQKNVLNVDEDHHHGHEHSHEHEHEHHHEHKQDHQHVPITKLKFVAWR